MHRELLEAMSAGAENCRRADSISYIYNQPVFEYEGNCGEMGTARRISELARPFSNEMRQFPARHVPDFEITADGYRTLYALRRPGWPTLCGLCKGWAILLFGLGSGPNDE